MSSSRRAVGASLKKFINHLKDVSKKNGKSLLWLELHFLLCFFSNGIGFTEYLLYEFWRKSRKERNEYATVKDVDKFYLKVSPPQNHALFATKYIFLETFKDYIGREYLVPDADNFEAFKVFCEKHPSFMVKPYDESGGKGVHRKQSDQIDDLKQYHQSLFENHLYVEEQIQQHPDLAAICETSVNTIRVMTSNVAGKAAILYAGLRIGNGADVDSSYAGGMLTYVNTDTGVLEGNAVNMALEEFETHPISGVKFDGYVIPMWDEVRRMCLEASFVHPQVHVVGWDVAITPTGPVFVEGNRTPNFPQVPSRRGRKDIIRQVLGELKTASNK